jgi:hypothetical protein
MSDLRREANRGQRARAILEDEIVTEALDAIEAELRADWEAVLTMRRGARLPIACCGRPKRFASGCAR